MLVTAAGGGWNEEPAAIADCTCLNLTKPRAVRSTNVTPSVRIILLAMSSPLIETQIITVPTCMTNGHSADRQITQHFLAWPKNLQNIVYRNSSSSFDHQASLHKEVTGAESDTRYGYLFKRGHSHQGLASCPNNVSSGTSQESLAVLVGIPFQN